MPEVKAYTISRVLNAPIDLVYKAHTEPRHLEKWMSPAGFTVIKSDMDFKVGGIHHYGQKSPDGTEMWGKQVYREIVPNEKLVYIQAFADKDGKLSRHPLSPTWPQEMLATLTFEDLGNKKTKVTISWHPYNASDIENSTFDAARAGMDQGFGGMFANLDAYLAKIQA